MIKCDNVKVGGPREILFEQEKLEQDRSKLRKPTRSTHEEEGRRAEGV